MKTVSRALGLIAVICLPAACTTQEQQEGYILGQATADNIAIQAVRDVVLPNSKAVETTSGVRAAQAVKALNEGKTKELRQASANATGGS
ncbi:hypothetical protein [Hyphomonas pacifica]|uniref:Uncharacterized protein n=1 Tax=Hyphomonas pacifica TaxID=1280941 RepID=A0A8B2PLC3_9PROT|nr:hypothetical protein [Hyphomonas pacifica]RAN34269.1 hypothetical protein HY3_01295 [Hyphomonas pacifica]